jgi:hypothetical protein
MAAVSEGSIFRGTAVFSGKAGVLTVLPDGVLAGDDEQAAREMTNRRLKMVRCKRLKFICLISPGFFLIQNIDKVYGLLLYYLRSNFRVQYNPPDIGSVELSEPNLRR